MVPPFRCSRGLQCLARMKHKTGSHFPGNLARLLQPAAGMQVRQLFARASAAAPCVLFFDEMDALAPRRGADATQSERYLSSMMRNGSMAAAENYVTLTNCSGVWTSAVSSLR